MTDRVAQVRVRYDAPPEPALGADRFVLALPTDAERSGVELVAELKRPAVVREALHTLGDVLASDLRRKASDRADYLAYLLAQGKRATKELWEAQKAFLAEKYGEAVGREAPLDPIVTVDSTGVAIEVFSADESAYARLHLRAGEAYEATSMSPGTTHVRIDADVLSHLGSMRSYRSSALQLVSSQPEAAARSFEVPYRWIRAFGQVQAASTLPAHVVELDPIDLYNVLLVLRMNRAKKPPRALRYELVPGEPARMVLEPWDRLIESHGPPYGGSMPVVVRTWGRQRLSVLSRLLPHARRVRVALVGAGLPAYYVIDLGIATLTLALSGWTDSGWAGIATFDLLVADAVDDILARQVLDACSKPGGASLEELVEHTGRSRAEVRQAILGHMQAGVLVHDLGSDRHLHRALFAEPLEADALRYRDDREEQAHRLLATPDAVRITRIHDLGGEGVRIEGEVEDAQAHRSYKTSFTIDREGRTVDASCTSAQFRRSGLREGPTVPMIALRLRHIREQAELERARDTEEGRRLIRAETRTLIRRDPKGSTTYRLSLDDRQVVVRWGSSPERMRMQRLMFTSPDEARTEYFSRLDRLSHKGFIDATAAEAT
jgi:predicted DNA-binding WGR domain protein